MMDSWLGAGQPRTRENRRSRPVRAGLSPAPVFVLATGMVTSPLAIAGVTVWGGSCDPDNRWYACCRDEKAAEEATAGRQ